MEQFMCSIMWSCIETFELHAHGRSGGYISENRMCSLRKIVHDQWTIKTHERADDYTSKEINNTP